MANHLFRIILFCCLSLPFLVQATHNRAGEITYSHVSGNKYRFTVTTYTEIGGNQADRPFIPINWGDNTGNDSIQRTNRTKISDIIQKNTYTQTHTFPGPGRYVVSMLDPNRNADIENIENSVNIPFYIESVLIIDPLTGGTNNSVQLLNPPIDNACGGIPFTHNPTAWDPDGDSLVFSLAPCKGSGGIVLPSFSWPPAVNQLTIDPFTGTMLWDYPPAKIAEYNIAILIEEYRNGEIIGSVLRDMQITVFNPCSHLPPTISDIENQCVDAEEVLDFEIIASDTIDGNNPNDGDRVDLTAFGGPFVVNDPASFTTTGSLTVTGRFFWSTTCAHIRKRPYQVVFKALDNGIPSLSSYKTLEIEVVAKAPENIALEVVNNNLEVSWDKSICTNALGYQIYRRLGSQDFDPDPCQTGVPPELGYELIHVDSSIETTSYIDDNSGLGLIPGEEYCYRVISFFEDGSESYTSEEVCYRLRKESPIITNVSVRETDSENGSIFIGWSKPTEHDSIKYPGPYRYLILRSLGTVFDQFVPIDSTPTENDTTYIDSFLNTLDKEYAYKIEMYDLSDDRELMGFSVVATSTYLKSNPKDNRLILYWNENTPWRNQEYVVYKRNPVTDEFDSLGTTSNQYFTDSNLTNGREYCYRLVCFGEYSVSGIQKPLINWSQIHCNVPIDLQPPCPPELTIDKLNCQEIIQQTEQSDDIIQPCGSEFKLDEIRLSWTNPNLVCDTTDDVLYYNIYRTELKSHPFEKVVSNIDQAITEYYYQNENSVAGCYYVSAVDSFGNESAFVDSVCVDNCDLYRLPNVFTPNNDGMNDFFAPFPFCFVESVDLKVFDRWGVLMYETTDPQILWDGTNSQNKEPAAEGTYFYTCKVNQITIDGIREKSLNGFVHLLRSNENPSN